MAKNLFIKLKESSFSVLPVYLIVILLALSGAVGFSYSEIIIFTLSSVLLAVGIAAFNLGADLAMTPMGEQIGCGLTKSGKPLLLIGICFIMGLFITVAEPDLSVLANQTGALINSNALIITVGVGVGIFLIFAVIKIVTKKDLPSLLLFFYMIIFALTAILIDLGHEDMLAIAFDSGGVTTGPITVPFIMALGVGISSTIGGRDANENSFGLIALCSIGPMLAVIILSLLSSGNVEYTLMDYEVKTEGLLGVLGETVSEVLIALSLIVLFFFILNATVLKIKKVKIIGILIGIIYTLFGLIIFLFAVKVGFMPIGYKIGKELAGRKTLVLIFAFVIGCVTVLAEPAIHVLNRQVEQITSGAVTKTSMLIALSLGVGISIFLSVIRITLGFSLLYYLIPGYCISLLLSLFVPKLYSSIAFDSGGVASGPLTSSFILPFAIGACTAVGGNVISDAFGVVAMVAMTPLITIQFLGFRSVFKAKVKRKIAVMRIMDESDEQIIYFDLGDDDGKQ